MTGFNSKRDMANDKDALFQKFEVAQPAQDWKTMPKKDAPLVEWAKNQTPSQTTQEPMAYVTGMSFGRFIVEPLNPAMVLPVGMALYSSPQVK